MAGTLVVDTIQSSVSGSPPTINDGTGTQIGTLCRAWVNFNGLSGSVGIRSAFNVSSVTRNGTGDYTVTFTNAMTDANYATSATVLFGTIGNKGGIEVDSTGSFPTSSAVRVRTYTSSTAAADSNTVYVAIFR